MKITLPISKWEAIIYDWIPSNVEREFNRITLDGQKQKYDSKKLTDEEAREFLSEEDYATYVTASGETKEKLHQKAKILKTNAASVREVEFNTLVKAQTVKTIMMVRSIDTKGDEEFKDYSTDELLDLMPSDDFDFIATKVADISNEQAQKAKKSGASVEKS